MVFGLTTSVSSSEASQQAIESFAKVLANRLDLVIKHKKYLDILKWEETNPKVGAALENFPAHTQKKVPCRQEKNDPTERAKRTTRTTPKITNFCSQRWWPISTWGHYFAIFTSRPPSFSNVVAHGICMRMALRR
jgi:hypothetical protein